MEWRPRIGSLFLWSLWSDADINRPEIFCAIVTPVQVSLVGSDIGDVKTGLALWDPFLQALGQHRLPELDVLAWEGGHFEQTVWLVPEGHVVAVRLVHVHCCRSRG